MSEFIIPGFGFTKEELMSEDIPIQTPENGVTIEYTVADDGYKYVSCINLPRPIRVDNYEALDLFSFLIEALCRRFDSNGSSEKFDTFNGKWVIESAIPKTRE